MEYTTRAQAWTKVRDALDAFMSNPNVTTGDRGAMAEALSTAVNMASNLRFLVAVADMADAEYDAVFND